MKKPTFFLLVLLAWCSPVFAAPHITRSIPEPLELPGRTLQERFARSAAEGMLPSAPLSYATPQTVNILFLRVEFQPDLDPLTTGSGAWTDALYLHNSDPDYWVDKARTSFPVYWKEVSYGLLTVTIDVSPKVYQLPHTMTSYAGGTAPPIENFIYDSIVTASTDTTLNFALYDGVFIIHAGVGQETDITGATPNDLWSLFYSGGTRICQNAGTAPCVTTLLKDGKALSEAIIMPQTDVRTNLNPPLIVDPLGVYVHEFGHWLGLPDLYCTLTTGCATEGVGDWSLMDEGSYNAVPGGIRGSTPAHLDAWSLKFLGWVTPQIITDYRSSLSLPSVESVPPPATPAAGTHILRAQASTAKATQYFLIENRQQLGFDAGLPGHGLLVWLIDDDVVGPGLSSNTVNSGPHPGVKLIEADGDWTLQNPATREFGSSGDPFPGSTSNSTLTPVTKPSSLSYTNYGNVNIRNITEAFQLVAFSLGFGPLSPTGLAVNGGTKTLSWSMVAGATYNVYKNGALAAQVPAMSSPSYLDNSYHATDVYAVTAVDVNGNESQPAIIAPTIIVTPVSLTFSDAITSNVVTVTNSGSVDLMLQSITLTGADAAEFQFTSACQTSLAPGASCAITVTFSPATTGAKTAALELMSNDPVSPLVSITLTGTRSQTVQTVDNGGGGHHKQYCFIATAAYGSYLDPHVDILRSFRDQYLLTNPLGRSFVCFYYRNSPPIAGFISRHDALRTTARWALTPLVFGAKYPVVFLLLFATAVLLMVRYVLSRYS